ncbi:helix-turn-helix transcriptional regulator [Paracoccus angustae]|uniref:Helix-turn-helix transcriptional regulator n=1 Tax=Paracoccus angustae TaxID=1671480 RepID=A0ABV7U247_9RHOB
MEEVKSNNGGKGLGVEKEAEALLRHRVAEAISAGGGVKAVSAKTGIPKGTIEKYAAETATPSVVRAAVIASALKIKLDDLAGLLDPSMGTGGFFEAAQLHLRSSGAHGSDADSGHMIRLPVYGDVQAAAGFSSIPVSELAQGIMAFDRRFLRDQGAAPEHCSVIWTKGDSMTPTIPDGSALIVDRSQTAIANGCIMVIAVGDDLLVKRVRRRLDGLVELVSDNSSYPPETLGPDMLQQLRVVGRVVYFCRTP